MRWKKIFVVGLLLAFFSWGFVHAGLVYLYDMNPWKLFGMAMYCVPASDLAAIHFADVTTVRQLIPYPERVSPDEYRKQMRFLTFREHTGSLVPPDLLAEHAFQLHPDMSRLEIVIVFWSYSLAERQMKKHADAYLYERVEPGRSTARRIRGDLG